MRNTKKKHRIRPLKFDPLIERFHKLTHLLTIFSNYMNYVFKKKEREEKRKKKFTGIVQAEREETQQNFVIMMLMVLMHRF